jgi:uncharacterized protein YdaT
MFGWFKKNKNKKEVVEQAPKPVKETVKEEPKKEMKEPLEPGSKEEANAPKKRKAAMHITKHKDGGWQVKKGGAQRALRKFNTQKEAIEFAKKIEQEKGTGYIIHKANGSTRKKTY